MTVKERLQLAYEDGFVDGLDAAWSAIEEPKKVKEVEKPLPEGWERSIQEGY